MPRPLLPSFESDLFVLKWFENLIDPYPEAPPQEPPQAFWPFLWFCTLGLRRYLLAITALTAVIGVFEAYLFSALGSVVDWLGTAKPERFFYTQKSALLTLALILFLSPLAVAAQTWIKRQTLAGNFPMLLRWNFHRLMLSQSMAFYQDEFAGRVAAKVMQTALAARDTWMILTDILVFVIIYFITMGAVLGAFDPWLLAPFGLWLALYAAAVAYFVPRLGRASTEQSDARSTMTGRMSDAYANIATVKLFSHSRREADYAREAMQSFMLTARAQMRLVSGFELVNHALSMLLIAGTAGSALWLWTQGSVGPGAVASSTAMALRLNGISHWVMWEMASLFESLGAVQDGLSSLSKQKAVMDAPNAQPLRVTRGAIDFQEVGFSYGGPTPVIPGLTLNVKAGEKVGLVGRSGAGKSTLLSLLLRFYDPQNGRVLIDGQDIALCSQDSLRAQIGMVTQDTSLLHRSIKDNLMYGRPDATDEQMIAAAQAAQASDFIAALADDKGRSGYHAQVGERGVKLSGGQRQRLAIARVMLKDASILLLDEATSALDSEVEAAIQDSLQTLMRGKTVIAIAHRLSTIAAMDRLIVLDGGRVAEEGTHEQLLALNGIYASLWARQIGGFLVED